MRIPRPLTPAILSVLLFALLLPGCIFAAVHDESGNQEAPSKPTSSGPATSWSWSFGGSTTADRKGSFEAPGGSAALSINAGGQGGITVIVKDGDGKTVFEHGISGSGGDTIQRTLDGAPGDWDIHLKVHHWNGGITVDVQGR